MIQEGRSRLQRGLKSRRLALAARPPAHARLTTLAVFLLWPRYPKSKEIALVGTERVWCMGLPGNLEKSLYKKKAEVNHKRNELRRPRIDLVTAPQRGRQSESLAVTLGRCTDPST